MTSLQVVDLGLITLALAMFAATAGVWFRYAIPKAPIHFRIILVGPMLVSPLSLLVLAYMVHSGDEIVFGLDGLGFLAVYFAAQTIVWWTFDFYAVYHLVRGIRSRARHEETEARLERKAAEQERRLAQEDRDKSQVDRDEGHTHRRPNED